MQSGARSDFNKLFERSYPTPLLSIVQENVRSGSVFVLLCHTSYHQQQVSPSDDNTATGDRSAIVTSAVPTMLLMLVRHLRLL